jgi:tetratricopeptide (TPR) repeat protein
MRLLLLFIVLTLPPPLVPMMMPAQSGEEDGNAALEKRDYPAAIRIFSARTGADPKDYSAWFNLALAESAAQKDSDAVIHYQRVLELKPDLYEAHLNLGIVLLRDHQNADAAKHFAEAVKLKPDQFRPQLYMAESLLASGDDRGAAAAFEKAVQLDPKSARSELGWGQSLVHIGLLDQAAPHYQRAAELDPKLKSYQMELASAYSNSQRPADAIAILKQFPDDPAAAAQLGHLYLAAGQTDEATAQYEATFKASPTLENELALATAYLKANQPQKAAPLLDHALTRNPSDYEIWMTAGRIYRDQKEYGRAANHFAAAAKLRPDSAEAWNELAAVSVIAGQYPQALDALDQLHRLNKEIAGDFYLRAIVLDKLHQLKPALANYKRFLELSEGKNPDEEFIARQRARIIDNELNRR